MTPPINPVMLYGGAMDGTDMLAPEASQGIFVKHPISGAETLYQPSDEWTAYFKKRVFIPENFPGRPPAGELTAA